MLAAKFLPGARIRADPKPSDSGATEPKFKDDPFVKLVQELGVIKAHPRMLTLITHGFIELIVNALIDDTCKNAKKITTNRRDFSHSAKLLILNEKGVLPDHSFQLLNWVRKLRNDLAHDPFFKSTAERMDIYDDEKFRDPDAFYEVCVAILLALWTEHQGTIGKNFLPSFYKEVDVPVLMVEKPAPKESSPDKGSSLISDSRRQIDG